MRRPYIGGGRARTTALGLAVLCVVVGSSSTAHVVYQRRTLRQWAQQADAVVVAEIVSPLAVWNAPDGSDHQEFFSIRVEEVIAGTPDGDRLDVFPHAEGEPRYAAGDRALLFLDRTASRAELARLAARFPYFTTQGAGHEWVLTETDSEIPSIARAWRELRADGNPGARRALLVRELEQANPQLRAEALADLTQLGSDQGGALDRQTAARLTDLVRSERLGVAERIALIRILERDPDYPAAGEMARLADRAGDPRERLTVIRASGSLRGPAITDWLRQRLHEADPDVRCAALFALAQSWHQAAVPEIVALVQDETVARRVGTAAVRTLGAIADPAAIAALRGVAEQRRPPLSGLARAELARLERAR
jgi:HEAT repeat protein